MPDQIPTINYAKGDEQDFVLLASNTVPFTLKAQIQGLLRNVSLLQFFSAASAGGASAVANGDLTLMRSLSIKDTIHGTIWQDMDGLGIYRILTMLKGAAPARDTLSTSLMGVRWPLDLGHYGVLRHPAKRISDSALWEFADTLKITGFLGPVTDIMSGGSPAYTTRLSEIVEFEPNPNPAPPAAPQGDLVQQQATSGGDRPLWMPEFVRYDSANLQVGNTDQPMLIGQGRIPIWLFIKESDLSNGEQSDVFTQYTTELTLTHGKTSWFTSIPLSHWDKKMADYFGPGFSMPSGWHAIPFAPDSKILDSLTLDPVTVLNLRMTNVAKAGANSRKLSFYQLNMVPVPGTASPEAQLATLKS